MMAGILVAVICAFAAVNSSLFMTAVARLFSPWQSVAYPTRTHLELDGGDLIVKEGDGLRIRARLSGVIPADAKLSIRTGEGEANKRTLVVVDNACEYEMAAVFRSFEYAISAGDARSGWHTVTVIGSPQVARTRIRVVYPAYMNRAPETNDAMTLTVPEGARLEWDLLLDRPVSSAAFSIEGAEPAPLRVGGDGLTVRHEMEAGASGAYSFSWVEKQHGFGFNSAKNYLQVAPDQPPQIELVSPGKNLFATIGRRMDLAFRAWDDHGIGETKIAYRHNDAEEMLVPIPFEASVGRKVQTSDWDYRKAVTGLVVGDTITFAIEVGDLYPATDGRHHVRSGSRRVSFLSKDDYLAKIHEQKQRLLSSLRSAYRQERAAHDVIRNLDPTDDAFEQTCFLEASRQDIIMERITSLNGGVRDLIDDLNANHITDKSEFEQLEEMQANLAAISKDHISAAVSQLRELGASAKSDATQVATTTVTVNTTARELGSLVLQLGVNEAMEVFARELHVIAQSQNSLRVRTIGAVGESAALSREQEELAGWIGRLLGELGGISDYSKSPLTIVRLARMIKDLRGAGIEPSMRKVAELLGSGKGAEAASLQKAIIAEMFGLECNIRVGAEREALLDARNFFTSSINELNQTASANDRRSPEELAQKLGGLHRAIRLLVIPAIPAPEPEFLVAKPTEIPPVEDLLASVVDSLQQAIESVRAGEPDPSRVRQRQAVASLQQLNGIVDTRLAEITKTARYAGNSGASMERSSLIRELLSSQMRLTEKTEDADYDKTSGAYLAPSQLQLSKEVLRMRDRLEKMNSRTSLKKPGRALPRAENSFCKSSRTLARPSMT